MCGSQETTKELDSGIEIIHGCFTKRGDYILLYKLLRVNIYRTSNKFLAIRHAGCTQSRTLSLSNVKFYSCIYVFTYM